MPNKVLLKDLSVAVQNAVEQTLAKHGAVPIEKLWVGFVAPDAIANAEQVAQQVANHIATGAHVTASVGQVNVAVQGGAAAAKPNIAPHHILGLIWDPNAVRKS